MVGWKDRVTLSALAAWVVIEPVVAQDNLVTLRIAGWNMESGESDDATLGRQLGEKQGVDVWGLCEVQNDAAATVFERGAEEGEGADYRRVLGSTGGGDRLAILYNADRLELLGSEELTDIQPTSGQRAPLVAELRGRETGISFKFMVNHLARGNAEARLEQAQRLNAWAKEQTLPVVAVCDYNFDYHVSFGEQGDRDPGFDAMTEDAAWLWVEPEHLVKTQADDRFASVLDFVFVANPPPGWTGVSRILERDGDQPAAMLDFDDDLQQTDHRPVDAVFRFNPSPDADDRDNERESADPAVARNEILRRLEQLERGLAELQGLLQER